MMFRRKGCLCVFYALNTRMVKRIVLTVLLEVEAKQLRRILFCVLKVGKAFCKITQTKTTYQNVKLKQKTDPNVLLFQCIIFSMDSMRVMRNTGGILIFPRGRASYPRGNAVYPREIANSPGGVRILLRRCIIQQ